MGDLLVLAGFRILGYCWFLDLKVGLIGIVNVFIKFFLILLCIITFDLLRLGFVLGDASG